MTREFKLPLAILDDPAFSQDPRAHPHFPLANARSYKATPPKPPSSPSTSPTASSPVTSRSQSPALLRSSITSASPLSKPTHRPPPLLVPEILRRSDSTSAVLKPVQLNVPRRARMKAFVRHLTTRHSLDPIDELDETDPFGTNYHHDGPYEAIGTVLTQPVLPRVHGVAASRGGIAYHPKRQSDPHPVRLSQHHSAYQGPPTYAETGLSLHLEPGQILQQNAVYASHVSTIAGQFPSQSSTAPILGRSNPSRRQSLPNPRTRPRQDPSSLGLRDNFPDRQPYSLRAPQERYFGDYAPDIPNSLPLHHDHPPYIHHQTAKTVFPPPRRESRLHSTGPPRSSQRTPPSSLSSVSPKTQSTENVVLALPRHDSRHKSAHSLDSSGTIDHMFTPSTSSTHHNPSESLRVRHLPKLLVMPAPLQPQPPPQPQHNFLPAELPAWRDEYPDDHTFEGAHFEGKLVMYSQEPRLLRKKSSAFPAKTPIPEHVPMSQDDAVTITGNSQTKMTSEVEGTKERTRRRRLSKRKNDI